MTNAESSDSGVNFATGGTAGVSDGQSGIEHKKKVLQEHATGQSTRVEDLCRVVLELAQNPSVSGQVFNVDSRVL